MHTVTANADTKEPNHDSNDQILLQTNQTRKQIMIFKKGSNSDTNQSNPDANQSNLDANQSDPDASNDTKDQNLIQTQ